MSTISGLGGSSPSWQGAQSAQSGQTRKAEHEARMFAKVDSDGSGSVDATELAAMLEHSGQSGDSAELLKKMDGNGDGGLSSDKLSQGMRDLMPPPASTLDFAQSRGAANDDQGFDRLDTDGDGQLSRAEFKAGRPSGPPPAASSASPTTGTNATTTAYDPLDVNQDGTVSQLEKLAGELKELAKAGASDSGQGGVKTEIAALAQKLYDQISKNWLQADSTAQVSTTA
ncbi:MAG: EF-hand domain-containing protein [Burkholderiales bacterium]|nr:EF-hand domain-containing protein [Burkholderiales bacterium]